MVHGEAGTNQAPLDLGRARWSQAVRVGVVGARTMHKEAKLRRRPDGTRRPPRLRRIGAMNLPGPLRLYALVVTNVLTMGTSPYRVLRSADDVAAVAATSAQESGVEKIRRKLRAVRRVMMVEIVGVAAGLAVARITHSWWIPGIIVFIVAAPVLWPVLPTIWELPAMKPLRQAQEAVVATATGPVYIATGLIGGDGGAALELVKAVAAEARDNDVTLVGRTEAGVLVRFYERAGFAVVASADAWWGTAVLVVCRPSDSGGVSARPSGL